MALYIDGKVIELSGIQDNLAKSHVASAFDKYNSGEEKIVFKKKGSELKAILHVKKYALEAIKNTCTAKMAAMKQEVGESKSGSREGHVDNIEVYMNNPMPHDTVKQLTEEEKLAHSQYRDAMYKIALVDKDLKVVNTLLKHIEDNGTYELNLQQMNSIEKSDIAYAFGNGYGQEKTMTFNKKGSEIKGMLSAKVADYEGKKAAFMTEANTLRAKLVEAGHQPEGSEDTIREGSGYEEKGMPRFAWKQYEGDEATNVSKENANMMRTYNDLCYAIEGCNRDLRAAMILIENMEDNKSYPLNVNQLTAIKKSGESDFLSKAVEAEQEKVGKLMKGVEMGELSFEEAVAVAMPEADIEKGESEEKPAKEPSKLKKAMDDAFDVLGVDSFDEEPIQKGEESEELEDDTITKGNVKGYYRTLANGKKVFVKQHTDSRTKKEKTSGGGKSLKVGDIVYNKKHNTVGIVRMSESEMGEGSGEVKTDADGNVNISDLEKFDSSKHKDYKIAPSTKKEIGLDTAEGGDKKEGGKKSHKEVKAEYDKNEEGNQHAENVVLLAKHYGSEGDVKQAEAMKNLSDKKGYMPSDVSKRSYELQKPLYERMMSDLKKEEGGDKQESSSPKYMDEHEESSNKEIASDAKKISDWTYSQKWSDDDGTLKEKLEKMKSVFEKKHGVKVKSGEDNGGDEKKPSGGEKKISKELKEAANDAVRDYNKKGQLLGDSIDSAIKEFETSKSDQKSDKDKNDYQLAIDYLKGLRAKLDKKEEGGDKKNEGSKKEKEAVSKLDDNSIVFGVNAKDIKTLVNNPEATHKWDNDHFNKVESALDKVMSSKKEEGGDKSPSLSNSTEGTKNKTPEASKVLQLMDKDHSYQDALKKVLAEDKNLDKKTLEKELNKYI